MKGNFKSFIPPQLSLSPQGNNIDHIKRGRNPNKKNIIVLVLSYNPTNEKLGVAVSQIKQHE